MFGACAVIKAGLVFLLVVLAPHQMRRDHARVFVVWNVGQGQWITYYNGDRCLHFDAGGERSPLTFVKKLCGDGPQSLWLSHWDFDHVNFALELKRAAHRLCAAGWPLGKISPAKRKIRHAIPECTARPLAWLYQPESGSSSNSFSRVALQNRWLIPGDAPSKEEAKWLLKARLKETRVLVAGHHGSKTSTSEALLARLPQLRQAVISARKRRYGHPHPTIMLRFVSHGIAAIKTEDWGHLFFAQ